MSFAIIRTKRLKTISAACAHNLRTKYAKNVDPSKSHLNRVLVDELGFADKAISNNGSYSTRLADYYKQKDAAIRSNSCMAMEFVLTASPQFFENCSPVQFEQWKKTQMDFLRKEFGDKLKFVVLHLDETSPHFHAMVSVEETKVRKFKNRYGQGEKMSTVLNADRFNPEYLRQLQDRYAGANKKFGLKRGLKNSRAVHTTLKKFAREVEIFSKMADYSKAVDRVIEEIPSLLGTCRKSDIKKHLTPVLNRVLKQAKASKIANKELPEKIQTVNKLLEENENEKQSLADLREIYREAINTKQADAKLIAEQEKSISALQEEIKRLKVKFGDDRGGDIASSLNTVSDFELRKLRPKRKS